MKQTRSTLRFRRSSEVVAKYCLLGLLLFWNWPAASQAVTNFDVPSAILVIDQDRLFTETQLGSRAREELEARAELLNNENKSIEAELVAREKELTELRSTMGAQQFRELADEFDERVERIRFEQDEKARELNRAGELARQNFFQQVAGVVSQIVEEKGAVVVFERRNLIYVDGRIDITDEAIERVNQLAE